jgi:hypothetical protein
MVLALAAARAEALATFAVTHLNDSGAGSLRDAIAQANAAPCADIIIDGNSGSRIFNVTDASPVARPGATGPVDSAVVQRDMMLDNARAADVVSGGAIASFHSLTLERMIVRDSRANQGGGVALATRYDGQTLTITTFATFGVNLCNLWGQSRNNSAVGLRSTFGVRVVAIRPWVCVRTGDSELLRL